MILFDATRAMLPLITADAYAKMCQSMPLDAYDADAIITFFAFELPLFHAFIFFR